MKSIAIFAHNEEKLIEKTISSLDKAGLTKEDRVYVLINGCTDNTLSVVETFSKKDKRINPVHIPFGDKANAWNVYVDQIGSEESSIHIFMDGDIIPSENSFNYMQAALDEHSEALVASTLPRGGKRSESWAKYIVEKHGMPGNLYGVKAQTFKKLKYIPIRLPIGLVGDDPFLRFLFLRNLNPKNTVDLNCVRPVPNAFFEYKSFPLNTVSGLIATWKRQVRYARRDLEQALLEKRLKEEGLTSMPHCADTLWKDFHKAIIMQKRLHIRTLIYPLTLLQAWLKPKLKFTTKTWDENMF